MGFTRNLEPYEIVEQVLLMSRAAGRISHIVFMGMGEPLLNLPAVRKAVAVMTHPRGQAISTRRMTISTCGITAGIRELADEGPPVRLALSLITADQTLRESLLPSARTNSLSRIKEALIYFQKKRRKRITMEIVLLSGINNREGDIEALKRFVPPLKTIINLIPWNPVPGLTFQAPTSSEIAAFRQALERAGFSVTERYRRGRGISAACGQLFALQDGPDPSHTG
jgi:23S rRNA (adenine2503-C2)-methyltransferase